MFVNSAPLIFEEKLLTNYIMKRLVYSLLSLCFIFSLVSNSLNGQTTIDSYYGRWSLYLPGGAGWLEVHPESGYPDASLLWYGGSVVPVDNVYMDGEKLVVTQVHKVVRKKDIMGNGLWHYSRKWPRKVRIHLVRGYPNIGQVCEPRLRPDEFFRYVDARTPPEAIEIAHQRRRDLYLELVSVNCERNRSLGHIVLGIEQRGMIDRIVVLQVWNEEGC